MKYTPCFILAATLMVHPVFAKPPTRKSAACASYVGTTVYPVDFDSAVAGFKSLKPKSQFETISSYLERLTPEQKSAVHQEIIRGTPVPDSGNISYNADKKQLVLYPTFFGIGEDPGVQQSAESALPGADLGTDLNMYTKVSTKEITGPEYDANDEFGNRFKAVDNFITNGYILEPSVKLAPYGIFTPKNIQRSDYSLGQMIIEPEIAEKLIPKLQVAFVVTPIYPFFGIYKMDARKPTLQDRDTYSWTNLILIANFQCGLLLDGAGKVISAYPTT